MKITIDKYDPSWTRAFDNIKSELMRLIGYINPKVEHIGSSSVEGLSAKPIIDILVGVNSEHDLKQTIKPLIANNYIYYECYNEDMPYRRFFVKHKINPKELLIPSIITDREKIPSSATERYQRIAHIHVMRVNSEHWIRHIAFRGYLRTHPDIKNQYQQLKESLSTKEWVNGNEYNQAKDLFLKTEEAKAVKWYHNI